MEAVLLDPAFWQAIIGLSSDFEGSTDTVGMIRSVICVALGFTAGKYGMPKKTIGLIKVAVDKVAHREKNLKVTVKDQNDRDKA